MQPLLTEAQIREGILQVNAEATWEKDQEADLEKRLAECRLRRRGLSAQYDSLRVVLREWYGKEVSKPGFPFPVAEGEILF